jgi:type IV pilus assembly protein PilY1
VNNDGDLGYSFGNPVITKRKSDGKWVVLVTSGLNNVSPGTTGKGFLYVLDAGTGTVLEKIGTGAGDTTTPSGLGKIAAWTDNLSKDNTALRVYGGDILGNVWRFDLTVSPATVMRIASLKDGAGVAQPVTTRPELANVYGFPVVYIGTGRYLGDSDLANIGRQSLYAFRDLQSDLGNLRTSSRMVKQTINVFDTAHRSVTVSGVGWQNAVNPAYGWYVDFNPGAAPGDSPGERVTIDPQLVRGTVVVVTNVPNQSSCKAGGDSWIYQFSYLDGSSIPAAPVLSPPGNPVVNQIGLKNASNAVTVGMAIIRLSSGQFKAIVTDARGNKTTVALSMGTVTGQTGKRTSWRELSKD